jgi:hypothetical protein
MPLVLYSGIVNPVLKIGWARKHLDRLREEIANFRKNDLIRVTRHDDPERGLHVLNLDINDVPDEISLIAGDFLACARSSLDQLVWSIAKITTGYPGELSQVA